MPLSATRSGFELLEHSFDFDAHEHTASNGGHTDALDLFSVILDVGRRADLGGRFFRIG
jgi:hypothetical protein